MAMKSRSQWVNWKNEIREGKPTKPPMNPNQLSKYAKVDDPKTWNKFQQVMKNYQEGKVSGISFVLSGDDKITCIDLDHVRNPDTGEIIPEAQFFIDKFKGEAFIEISPSGTGIHIWFKAKLSGTYHKKSFKTADGTSWDIEIYDKLKAFTVTGWLLDESNKTPDICDCQAELDSTYKEIFGDKKPAISRDTPQASLNDAELIEIASHSKSGRNFEKLWAGDYGEYASQSEADLAFCNYLAFYTAKNSQQMDSLFRQSGLMRPKWDQKHGHGITYGQQIIEKAIEDCRNVYQPPMRTMESSNRQDLEEMWEPIIPLTGGEPPVMPQDLLKSAFPSWTLAALVNTAQSVMAPLDLAVLFCLGLTSAALGKKITCLIKPGYQTYSNLYIWAIARSGMGKSPLLSILSAFLMVSQKELEIKLRPDIANNASERRILEAERAQAEKIAATSKKPAEKASAHDKVGILNEQLADVPELSVPRLLVGDATPEKAANICKGNNGKLNIISAEGGILNNYTGQYSKNGNIDILLNGFSHDDTYVDRIGRQSDLIPDPSVVMLLATQPEFQTEFFSKPEIVSRGLAARFLIAQPPEVRKRDIRTAPAIDERIEAVYNAKMKKLCKLGWGTVDDIKYAIPLSVEAREQYYSFWEWLEPQRREMTGGLQYFSSKLDDMAVRIALLLHMLKHVDDERPWETAISGDTMRYGAEFAKYFLEQAKYIYGSVQLDPDLQNAAKILEWVNKGKYTSFSKREVFNALRSTFARVRDLDEPLETLEERNYIKPQEQPRERVTRGRKPSPQYKVNPYVFKPRPTKDEADYPVIKYNPPDGVDDESPATTNVTNDNLSWNDLGAFVKYDGGRC